MARQIRRGILCFRHQIGRKHTFDRQNSLFGASCVFPASRREFYNHLRVKRFLPIIGEKSFWSQTLQRNDRSDEVRTGDLSPQSGKIANFSRKVDFGCDVFGGGLAIVSGEDMVIHRRKNGIRAAGREKNSNFF